MACPGLLGQKWQTPVGNMVSTGIPDISFRNPRMTPDPVQQIRVDMIVLPSEKLSMTALYAQPAASVLKTLQKQLTVWCIHLAVHRAVMKHARHSDEAGKAVLSARQHQIMPSSL